MEYLDTDDSMDRALRETQKKDAVRIMTEDGRLVLPAEMTPAIAEVLGRPTVVCRPLAALLREAGQEIPDDDRAEQAAVVWFLLPFAVEHGAGWRTAVTQYLESRCDPRRPRSAL